MDSRTVEVMRACASGEWTRFIRRPAPNSTQLIMEVTRQQLDGRRLHRRLAPEKRCTYASESCKMVVMLKVLSFMIGAGLAQGQTMSFFQQFSTPAIDRATVVTPDGSAIYLIGAGRLMTYGSAGLRKYDSHGNELWTREFGPSGSEPGLGGAILVKAVGDGTGVYVTGYTRARSGDVNGQFIRKYSAAGDEQWTRQLEFIPGGLALDASGVYVTGAFFPNAGFYLRKYTPDGAELWTRRFQDPSLGPSYGPLAVDATGVYVFGPSSVRKWDPQGNELWNRKLDIPAYPAYPDYIVVAAAPPAGFFVAGYSSQGSILRKYDAEGNQLWSRPLGTSGTGVYPGGVAADAAGVYVAGTTDLAGPALPGQCRSGSGVDSFLRKYDLDGAEVWTREFSTSDAVWAGDVAVDSSGVYVVGRAGTALEDFEGLSMTPPAGRAFLAKFDKTAAAVSGSRPRILPDCVVNAASYVGGGVAPGELVTVFGSAMGPSQLVRSSPARDRSLPTVLAETRILFNGVAAPLLDVSDKQISAIVPDAAADGSSVEVQVEYRGVTSDPLTVPVLASRPGIFSVDGSGRGQAAIFNEDGMLNSSSNPARRGSTITILATGGGGPAPGATVIFDLTVDEFGNGPKLADVLDAGGSAGSEPGVLQIKVRVPANVRDTGDAVPFALFIGSQWTMNQVTVALR